MDSLIPYLAADIILLVVAGVFCVRTSAFWHPLTVYLFFHVYSFTWRVIQLILGAVPMYGNSIDLEVIRPGEFERAIMLADVALLCFTIGTALAQSHFRWKAQSPRMSRELKVSIVYAVSAFCLPTGLVVLALNKTGGEEIGEFFGANSFLGIMNLWSIACLVVLVFVKGFRPILIVPICAYLVIVGLQGYHRFMLILPVLGLSAIYLQGKGKKWPTFGMVVLGIATLFLFPSLKYIGRAVAGADYAAVGDLVSNAFSSTAEKNIRSEKEFASEEFLDQYAGALTMIDDGGKTYNGSTYLALLTLPIPRKFWPEKPGLADHLNDISNSGRPYSTEGRIITYIGESYLNFRYLGVGLIPLSLGFGLSYWCLVATTGPWLRLNRYLYIMAFMAFIQLFRDGLLSLPLFSLVHNTPTLFIWVAHMFAGRKAMVQDPPVASS